MKTRIYTPGAGHQPPVLAGRDDVLRDWRLMLNDTATRGRVGAEDTILLGPRGVGKTALLRAFVDEAEQNGCIVVNLQAVRGETGLIEALLHQARTLSAAEAGPWHR
ncbi:MAG: AAA family ATPase, partial [Nostocoides sp.]